MKIPGLANVSAARTHSNIAVVFLYRNRILVAAGHLNKAESFSSIEEIERVIGPETLSVFATVYYKTYQELYPTVPDQALPYLQKALKIPKQGENWYGRMHLELAVCYDRLLESHNSLRHALQALKCKHLTPGERDRALCFASFGSKDTDKPEDCIRYFGQIKALKDLIYTERYLVLSAVANIQFRKGNWDQGFLYGHQALDALVPTSPQYVLAKHNLATAYGEYGDKERERELYGEVLESITTHSFDPSWQESIQSIRMSIETVFFIKEMKRQEKRLREELEKQKQERIQAQQKVKKEELKRKQEREKRKQERHQQHIEKIKAAQKEAAEREQRLQDERRQRLERERTQIEELRSHPLIVDETPYEPSSTSEPSRYVPEKVKPKIKTRGVPAPIKAQEKETEESSTPTQPTFPPLGTRAKSVFSQIEEEDWSFTRDEYTHYLEDLLCTLRESGSAHRMFQLPKSVVVSLEKEGEEIQEQFFLADEDVKLGSVTLPAWKGTWRIQG